MLPGTNLRDSVQAGPWESQMGHIAHSAHGLPPESSVVPAGDPARDQKGRSVAHGGFGVGTPTVIGGFRNV